MTSGFASWCRLARTAPPPTRSKTRPRTIPTRHVFLGSRLRLRLPPHPASRLSSCHRLVVGAINLHRGLAPPSCWSCRAHTGTRVMPRYPRRRNPARPWTPDTRPPNDEAFASSCAARWASASSRCLPASPLPGERARPSGRRDRRPVAAARPAGPGSAISADRRPPHTRPHEDANTRRHHEIQEEHRRAGRALERPARCRPAAIASK